MGVSSDNDVLFVHRYIGLTGYVGRTVLFRHTFVRYIPNDSLLMRKSVPAKSEDNERIGRECYALHPAITDDIADRRIFCEQRDAWVKHPPIRCAVPIQKFPCNLGDHHRGVVVETVRIFFRIRFDKVPCFISMFTEFHLHKDT